MPNNLSIKELRSLISKGESKDPLVFLESVMSGQDPRATSRIHELVMEIDAFSGGEPDPEDWREIVEYVQDHMMYKTVSISESMAAGKTLAEYIHPKKKHVEISETNNSASIQDDPLTEEEIELFKEKFNDEF